MILTNELFKAMCPQATEANRGKYLPFLNKYMQEYGITTEKRIASFIAQIAHESVNFSAVVENLNYSAAGLLKTFSKYFNADTAAMYANKSEMIANRVYANRMGNGDESSGDGWRYRGRGLVQLTGKSGYYAFQQATGVNCLTDPTLLEKPDAAVHAACWYWKTYVASKLK